MNIKTVNISKDFSREPFGRDSKDGDSNGTKFRELYLLPALRAHREIVIEFDGAEGYGSSFLEEAFGGLVREGYSSESIRGLIKLISHDDPSIIDEVNEYIDDEAARAK